MLTEELISSGQYMAIEQKMDTKVWIIRQDLLWAVTPTTKSVVQCNNWEVETCSSVANGLPPAMVTCTNLILRDKLILKSKRARN